MSFLNIAGYKFISLSGLTELRGQLLQRCEELNLKGTILLSEEGINLTLSGLPNDIENFKKILAPMLSNSAISFRESVSERIAFKRMKVKIKKEIITFRNPSIKPEKNTAPHITPEELKQWLDENRDLTILDTRNNYEVKFGTFKNAIDPETNDFCEFPTITSKLNRKKPIVMFCTGGIRCEKAGLYLQQEGFEEVYQLQGGILNYFEKVGGAHFEGECFVFDDRIALNSKLEETGTTQCAKCQGPVQKMQTHLCANV